MSFFEADRPLVFAHRGGCALGPENTLLAFDRGLAAGADGLELDVHLSADGIPVVHHDETLDRTTNASGPIRARTAAELRQMNAACRFAGGLQSGETVDPSLTGVPTLRDVLCRYPEARVIVEMKVDSPAMGLAVARDIRDCRAIERVCAAGYGTASLRTVREALPGLATSASYPEVRFALYRSWVRWPVRRVPYTGYQVPEYAGGLRVVSPVFIRHAHARGLKVQVWTVDDEADMRRLLGWGADAVITNRPGDARAICDARIDGGRGTANGTR